MCPFHRVEYWSSERWSHSLSMAFQLWSEWLQSPDHFPITCLQPCFLMSPQPLLPGSCMWMGFANLCTHEDLEGGKWGGSHLLVLFCSHRQGPEMRVFSSAEPQCPFSWPVGTKGPFSGRKKFLSLGLQLWPCILEFNSARGSLGGGSSPSGSVLLCWCIIPVGPVGPLPAPLALPTML